MDYQTFYSSIEKPFFAPEPWVFGLAWGIIYPLIAMAFAYALILAWRGRLEWKVIGVFVLNLASNFAFTPLQLDFPNQLYATFDIVVVVSTLAWLECYFWGRNKVLFFVLLPYLLWGCFATVLQVSIYLMNFV